LGESLAFALLPLVMLGIWRSAFGEYKRNYPLVFGFFFVAVSHNLSLLMMGILFALFILLSIGRYLRQPARIGYLAADAALVVMMAGFFLFPMLEQLLFAEFFTDTTLAEFNPADAAVRLLNMFVELGPDIYDYTPSLGLTMAGVLLLFLFAKKRAEGDDAVVFRNLCVLGAVGCIFMASAYFPYRQLDPLLNVLQFPWRWFMPCTMFLALAGAQMLDGLREKIAHKQVVVMAVVVVLLCSVQHLIVTVPTITQRYSAEVTEWESMLTSSDGFVNLDENYLHKNNIRSEYRNNRDGLPHVFDESIGIVLQGSRSYDEYTLQFFNKIDPAGNVWLEMPLIYYYGYSAVDEDGQTLAVRPSWRGYLEVMHPNEQGTVTVTYKKTAVQQFSPLLSVFVWVGFGIYYVAQKRKESAV
ncbi:MAG: hypothetical protein IJP01_00235, partial [Oscillospiraceae bacterium]|nr:hypothetical protein [Oscillospiraceae bacterium]